jgi:hypothetical protein
MDYVAEAHDDLLLDRVGLAADAGREVPARAMVGKSVFSVNASSPRQRIILDPPVRMPDHPPPRSAGMPQGKRFSPDLVYVVAARRLAPDDLPSALDRGRVVDAIAFVADPEHGGSEW